MDRVRAIVAASPSAGLALAAFVLAWAGAARPENRLAAWEWILVGAVFLLSAIARYGDCLGRAPPHIDYPTANAPPADMICAPHPSDARSVAQDARGVLKNTRPPVYYLNMTIQEIQRLQKAEPFEPFRVMVADGRTFDVRHPELLAQTGSGRLISIGQKDSFVTLDLLLVTGIEKPISKRNGHARRR